MKYSGLLFTILITAFLFSLPAYCNAQSALEINYKKTIERNKWNINMVCNDSFSIFYCKQSKGNPAGKKKIVGDKLFNYGIFTNFLNGEKLQARNFSRKEKYLVKIASAKNQWQFLSEEKMILGKTCHAALSVTEKNDSLFIWFTNELPFQHGSLYYDDIPGVVLEAIDQQSNRHIVATSIKEKMVRIVAPLEGKKISLEELPAEPVEITIHTSIN